MTPEAYADLFALEGKRIACKPFGNGHINGTFLIETDTGCKYVLQRINTSIFTDPVGLMNNFALVTDHLRKKDSDPRHVLTLVPTKDGKSYYLGEDGECWRITAFIPNSFSMEMAEKPEDMTMIGEAFGNFQLQLGDFAADSLVETIPHFHDTPDRYRQLKQAIKEDRAGRLSTVQKEVDFLLSREGVADTLMSLYHKGELPLRVTHNDTKINNIMLDKDSHQPLCIVDLDTVMPGLLANDYGEALRYGASTAAEDEIDLDKVSFSMTLFKAFTEGFVGKCGKTMTVTELDTLPWGVRLMTTENASRFLADYLNGDIYFGIARPNHNLDRARAQMKLLTSIEAQFEQMNAFIREMHSFLPC